MAEGLALPPKGTQLVHYAGLYARNVKRRCAELAHAALAAIRTQLLLFALEPLSKVVRTLTGRERIQASLGYDPLQCPCCGHTLVLTEIWEPRRGHIWMKCWLETHRQRKAALLAVEQLQAALPHARQLAFNFDTT